MTATKMGTQIRVNRVELSRKLDFVGLASESKSTIPILAMLKLSVSPKSLKLTTTNLDVSAHASMIIESDAEAEICVDAKRLARFVKTLPDAEVDLFVESAALCVQGARSKVSLPGLSADSYPDVQQAEGDSVALPAAGLDAVLKATAWAMSKDESRFSLAGVKLIVTSESLRGVALDGSSMAIADVHIVTQNGFDVLLPSQSIGAVYGLLAESKNEVFVTLNDRLITFETGNYAVSSRLGTGIFPNYEMVEKVRFRPCCSVEVSDLKDAIGRILLVSAESANKGKFIYLKSDGEDILINSEVSDLGEGTERVPSEMTAPLKVYLDGIRVINGINPCRSNKVEIAESGQFRFAAKWPVNDSLSLNYQFILAAGVDKKGEK